MKRVAKILTPVCLLLASASISAKELNCAQFQELVSDGLQSALQQSFSKEKAEQSYADMVPPEAEETLLITALKLVRKGYNLQQIGEAFEKAEQNEMIALVMTPVFNCGKQPEAPVSDVLLPEAEKLLKSKLG